VVDHPSHELAVVIDHADGLALAEIVRRHAVDMPGDEGRDLRRTVIDHPHICPPG
jgi:hypothetical protein